MTNKGKEDVMIYRDLGSTGEKVSLIGLGGWHLALKYVTEKTALRIMDEPLGRGELEPFKTSSIFDGTAENPDWIGKEPKRLQNLMP
jgi:aryl-alcohol dehydrogenase-like predicted oxidoreductase